MDLSKKYYLDKRCYLHILLIFLAFSTNVKAGNIDMPEAGVGNDPLIKDITYTYQLYENQTKIDCCGTLVLTLTLPADTEVLMFERTTRHIIDPDLNKVRYLCKSAYEMTTSLNIPNIYWGTCFRIRAILKDGSHEWSQNYTVNDFIDKEDLSILINSSDVDDIVVDEVSMQIENKILHISTPEIINLSIYDLFGKQMFNEIIHHEISIPLYNAGSQAIIVTYSNSKITKTKKILVQ
jgi:hypothetical protein